MSIQRPVYAYGDPFEWQIMEADGKRMRKAQQIEEAALCINLAPRLAEALRFQLLNHKIPAWGDRHCGPCEHCKLLDEWDKAMQSPAQCPDPKPES